MNNISFTELIKNTPYITKQNLGLVLDKRGENLKYWVRKLIRQGALIQLKKGFFVPKYFFDLNSMVGEEESEKYKIYLANQIRSPSYVSLEYVLAKYGFLAESVYSVTSITLKSTRSYSTSLGQFQYRHLKESLFFGYKIGTYRGKDMQEATLAKALFDYLYLRRFASQKVTREYLVESGRLNWGALSNVDVSEFKKIVRLSQSNKLKLILEFLEKSKLI